MIKSFALGALLSLAAVAAQAAPVVAELAQPIAKADTLVTGSTAWDCQGTTCRAEAMSETFSVDTCRDLGRQAGSALVAYGTSNRAFDAAKLAKCNAGLPAALTAKTAGAQTASR